MLKINPRVYLVMSVCHTLFVVGIVFTLVIMAGLVGSCVVILARFALLGVRSFWNVALVRVLAIFCFIHSFLRRHFPS